VSFAPAALPFGVRAERTLGPNFAGIAASLVVAGCAWLSVQAETAIVGRAWIEGVVAAILIGGAVATFGRTRPGWSAGVAFCAKRPLEIAIALLGASVSSAALTAMGPPLLAGLGVVVILSLGIGYGVSRAFGLSPRQSVLVASGNSICGNSAIAAVAPVVGANRDETCATIAFTAVLGVAAVLLLPLLAPLLGLSSASYGVLAGLTVYAVPQVLAATAPIGGAAVQVGAMVKLARVMMLGPLILVLSLAGGPRAVRPPLTRLAPWYIVAFAFLAAARTMGFLPAASLPAMAAACQVLTLISMAALGLSTDFRVAMRSGGRMAGAAVGSLGALTVLSLALLALLGRAGAL
jgi:uncharacterized integral membrane protein (TIGR00698 family)